MVDLSGVAHSSLAWLRAAARGYGFRSKALLLSLLPLRLFPRTIRRRYPAVSALRARLMRATLRKIVVTYRGCAFRLNDEESLGILSEVFEPWAWDYLALPSGAVFVDVGAHVGRYAIPAAKLVGEGGLVVAIEPAPENYRTLVENIRLNGLKNIVALNIAAWNSDGELDLYLAEDSGRHSVKERTDRKVRVAARALDTVLQELGITRVDAVKVDAEGAEVEVLEGMKRTVERCTPKLLVEVRWAHLERLAEMVEVWGYRVRPIPGSESVDGVYLVCEPEGASSGVRSGVMGVA